MIKTVLCTPLSDNITYEPRMDHISQNKISKFETINVVTVIHLKNIEE